MSRAYTQEEIQERFIDAIRGCACYWANCQLPKEQDTVSYRCNGVAFSILNILDGTSADFPAVELTVQPHPDDKQYHINNEEDWYEPGMTIHSGEYLHDLWHD